MNDHHDLNEKLMFIVAIAVGIFITTRFFLKRSSTIDDHVWGSSRMGLLPIALSIFASFISCISTSYAMEFYQNGIQFVFELVPITISSIAIIVQATVMLPLKFVSVNQTTVGTIVCYTTALEVGNILHTDRVTSFIATYAFCFVLAALGGFEGVVWTDAFQALIIVASLTTIAVIGATSVGGIGHVFRVAYDDGRLSVDFSMDPTKRLTIWSAMSSQVTNWLALNSLFSPSVYQRFVCLDRGQVKKGAFIVGAMTITYKLIICFVGLTMYAFYKGCDPVASGRLPRYDQMLQFYIGDLDNDWGLLRAIYSIGYISAGVSSITTVINTTGVVTYKDFLESWVNPTGKMRTGKMMIILVELAMMLGCTSLFLLMEGADSITRFVPLFSSPCAITAGSFILGMFIPCANSKGVLIGSIITLPLALLWSWSTNIATTRGSINHHYKPMTIDNCPFNVTLSTSGTETVEAYVFPLLRVSVFYQPIIMLAFHLGLSIVASRACKSPGDKLDEKLVHARCRRFIPRCYNLVLRT